MDDFAPDSIDGFLARSGVRPSTEREYRNRLEKCERLVGRPLAAATVRDLAGLKAQLRKQASGPGVVRNLGLFYRAIGRADLASVCRMKERLRVLRPDEILTPKDVETLMGGVITMRDRALVGVLWDLGWRVADVLSLDLGQVSRSPEGEGMPLRFRVFVASAKTNTPTEGWVKDSASALDAWIRVHPARNASSPLFCGADGHRLTTQRARQIVQAAARRSGLGKKAHPHAFRHARATYLLRMGLSDAAVKTLLGWSARSSQLARYGHLVSGDAYRSLLRAEGFSIPKPDTIERLEIADDTFKPVVPVIPSGTARGTQERAVELLRDAKVVEFLSLIAPKVAQYLREHPNDA